VQRHTVIVTKMVKAQVVDQMLYISADSIDHAFAWESRILSAMDILGEFPFRFPIDSAAFDRFGQCIRKMIFEKIYLVFCVVNDANQTVHIVNLRHGARLPQRGEP
jgi:plasmid stabilization system protein ParE